MSKTITRNQTNNQMTADYDISNLVLGQNSFIKGSITASGSDIDLLQGMVMGRISSTQKLVPLDASATNGSQYPVGICLIDAKIINGTSVDITLVNKGRIEEQKINFLGAETLDSVVSGRILRDWINDIGLELILSEELTNFDN